MRGGALKRTSDGQWVHMLCALLLDARFKDPVNIEPINVLTVNQSSITSQCAYCNQRNGACLKCQECNRQFHLTCGLSSGALFLIVDSESDNLIVRINFFKFNLG